MARNRLTPGLLRRGGLWLAVLAVAATVSAAAALLLPTALGHAVDGALGNAGAARWLVISSVLVGLLVLTGPLSDLAAGITAAGSAAWLRHRLIRHALGLLPGSGLAVGDLVTRVVSNAADAARTGTALILGLLGALPVLGSVVALAFIDPLVAGVLLVGSAAMALLLRAFVRDTSAVAVAYQQAQGEVAGRLSEALDGSRTVAAAGTADAETIRCLTPLPVLSGHGMTLWQVLARTAARTTVSAPVLQVVVLAVAGWELTRGRLTPGQLLAVIQYSALGAGLGGLLSALNGYARAKAGVRRAEELLALPAAGYGRADLAPGPGRLEFRRVTVHAGTGLRELDLTIPGGATVAVVGRSGSGKSLLAALAGRLRDPDDGAVLLDGVPLVELTADALQREIGFAFERPVLVGATVAEAVALGTPRPDLPGIHAALRAAQADTFVDRLPAGSATPLPDAPMSGGEAQRLGLARAWNARRLLVLDDATSSLDTATEAQITELLTSGADPRTHLIVAHRAATAARCDLVVWLADGRIRAVAPHRVLSRYHAYRAIFTAPAEQPHE